MNATMEKFGYPDTLIREYQHWVVLLRPQQATLGALVLACKDESEALSRISQAAFSELHEVTAAIEKHLRGCFSYDRINYLMLMMVDKDVHFHVLPRYAQARLFEQTEFKDSGWPGPPDLSYANEAGDEVKTLILRNLQRAFN